MLAANIAAAAIPVRLDMAFPKSIPITRQFMGFIALGQRTCFSQYSNDFFKQLLVTTTFQAFLIRALELIGKKNVVHHDSNSAISSDTLLTFVSFPLRTSSTARDKVPLRDGEVLAIVTPFRLLKILRKLGNILVSSTFNIICVIFSFVLTHLCDEYTKSYRYNKSFLIFLSRFVSAARPCGFCQSAGYEFQHLQMRETRNRFLRDENIPILTERGMNEHPP